MDRLERGLDTAREASADHRDERRAGGQPEGGAAQIEAPEGKEPQTTAGVEASAPSRAAAGGCELERGPCAAPDPQADGRHEPEVVTMEESPEEEEIAAAAEAAVAPLGAAETAASAAASRPELELGLEASSGWAAADVAALHWQARGAVRAVTSPPPPKRDFIPCIATHIYTQPIYST